MKQSNPTLSKSKIPPATEAYSYKGQEYDYLSRSVLGKYTNWLSPVSYSLVFSDWMMDLCISPARQMDIINKAYINNYQLMQYFMRNYFDKNCELCIHGLEQDRRFENPLWNQFPFNLYSQSLYAKNASFLSPNRQCLVL